MGTDEWTERELIAYERSRVRAGEARWVWRVKRARGKVVWLMQGTVPVKGRREFRCVFSICIPLTDVVKVRALLEKHGKGKA